MDLIGGKEGMKIMGYGFMLVSEVMSGGKRDNKGISIGKEGNVILVF